MISPFEYGNPVSNEYFIERKELRKIARNILSGRSSAIVGEPRSGKTTLLQALMNEQKRREVFGELPNQIIYTYVDSQMFGPQQSQSDFWKQILEPLYNICLSTHNSEVLDAYSICAQNSFRNYVLEKLFLCLQKYNIKLIVLIDEFDVLLFHPILNSAEFYGGLRSLASRLHKALVLVIASRNSLHDLNNQTQQFSRSGSPYFNFIDEITLGAFTEKARADLLKKADDVFSLDDRKFIARIAGAHPYFLQIVANELWNLYHEGVQDPNKRRFFAGEKLFSVTYGTISDCWNNWTPELRKTFTIIALDQAPLILKEHQVDTGELLKNLSDFPREIRYLQKNGYIIEDNSLENGWQIHPEVCLWWLTEELVKVFIDASPLDLWMSRQGWDGLLKKGEKAQLKSLILYISEIAKEGAKYMIKSAVAS